MVETFVAEARRERITIQRVSLNDPPPQAPRSLSEIYHTRDTSATTGKIFENPRVRVGNLPRAHSVAVLSRELVRVDATGDTDSLSFFA